MKKHEGTLQAQGLRFAVVAARFNSSITDRLLDGALDALRRHGTAEDDIEVVRVPGSFDIPLCARLLAATGQVQAGVCLGAVIKGDTPHAEYISSSVISALGRIMDKYDVPIALGILTTDSFQQAQERAGGKLGNKGYDAAVNAIELAAVCRALAGRAK